MVVNYTDFTLTSPAIQFLFDEFMDYTIMDSSHLLFV